ncbi:MAG: ectoine hydroxylase-related dioxygenase (phytanoyl-CoA dioxygenase family) [Candidatus Latescibacterota bacterium]|jgi:ectoine hydroxylase-related dioxygenase (phytanoyl-CoA dioxygenase family)
MQPALRAIAHDGFYIQKGVVPNAQVEAVRQSVLEAAQQHRQKDAPAQIAFVPSLLRYDDSAAPYLADVHLLQLVEALLGSHLRISFVSAIINERGNQRGDWHADWPFNQRNAGHIPSPYPDMLFHLTTLWMLSPFSAENGGTLIVPKSHRIPNNPTGENGVDPRAPHPNEIHVCGQAGDVLVFDSRLWHASAANMTTNPRVALAVRYAPWWLNLEVLRPGSDERRRMVDETGRKENEVPSLPRSTFETLPHTVKPLLRHWIKP